MDKGKCFECGNTNNIHFHHVVPNSKGGKYTIPLCESCHSLVHESNLKISYLTTLALFKKEKELFCRVFFLITAYRYTPIEIAKDLSEILETPIKTTRVYRLIKRLKSIETKDLLWVFEYLLDYKACEVYTEKFYEDSWSEFIKI